MSIVKKLMHFASSPQGRRAISQVKRAASDPRTRQQAKDALDKLRNKGKGDPPPPAGR